ncbi:TPA: FkbM family methyltransferase, partial [Escherichia coli]|nr:FkbM family methyltransferase [Escherichia coli]
MISTRYCNFQFKSYLQRATLLGNHKKTSIETKRLDDINDIKEVDLLKIDTQGSELNILVGGEQVLNNTLCIQLEVSFIPLYEGQPSFVKLT